MKPKREEKLISCSYIEKKYDYEHLLENLEVK